MFNEMSIHGDGRLTADPVMRTTKTGKHVVTFCIAVNHPGPGGKTAASFFNVETWEKVADRAMDLRKGQPVTVEGILRQDRFADNDGKTQVRIKIVAHRVLPLISTSKAKEESVAKPDYEPDFSMETED